MVSHTGIRIFLVKISLTLFLWTWRSLATGEHGVYGRSGTLPGTNRKSNKTREDKARQRGGDLWEQLGEWDRGQTLFLSPEPLLAAPSEKGIVSAGAEVCPWTPLWEYNLWDAFNRLAVFFPLFFLPARLGACSASVLSALSPFCHWL